MPIPLKLDDIHVVLDKFNDMFNHHPLIMSLSLPQSGKLIQVNQSFLDALGYTRDEVIGKTSEELQLFSDFQQRMLMVRQIMSKGMIQNFEIQVRKKDGSQLEGLFFGIMVKIKEERILFMAMTDLTEQKRLEKELEKAKDEAESISRLKSQFISKMSHEIKTPLSGILGFLQLLENTELTKDQEEFVSNIRLSSEMLYRVINDILDFSKMESKGVELEKQPFHLHKAIEDAAIPLTGAIVSQSLIFDLYIDSSVPEYVIGDSIRIAQIINNLVTNAIKFTEEGSIYLEITAQETKIQDEFILLIRINDTGIGMSKEVIEKLFHPFQQADETINRRYGGSGLGLTITKEIAEAMKGTIAVASEPGKGSEFLVKIRLQHDKEKEEETTAWKEMKTHLLDGTTVLIVDSGSMSGRILENYLKELGADTEWIQDTKSALLKIMQEPKISHYDMIFISDERKEIAYYDFLAICRSVSAANDIPIILIKPGNKASEEAHAYFEFSAKINKPFRKHELLLTILKQVTQDDEWTETDGYESEITEETRKRKRRPPFYDESGKKNRQRVLIVDDAPVNNRILVAALETEYDVIVAMNGYEAIRMALQVPHPDLILLDIMMPEISGFEVFEQIKDNPEIKDVPVIFLTALNDKETEEKGLRLGAVDYITKPFHVQTIKAKVNNLMLSQSKMNSFRVESTIDKLTNIANRRKFEEKLQSILSQSALTGWNLSVLMIDIDYFKKFNDRYGHIKGDECLKKVAEALQHAMHRREDFAARWGGEEFVCLLPNTGIDDACQIADRIRKDILELKIAHEASSINKYVTVSVGVTSISPTENKGIEDIINQADVALYEAKNFGRNQVMPYTGRDITTGHMPTLKKTEKT